MVESTLTQVEFIFSIDNSKYYQNPLYSFDIIPNLCLLQKPHRVSDH